MRLRPTSVSCCPIRRRRSAGRRQDGPALVAAFTEAKVTYVINNANGDAQRQRSQADQCLSNGAKVIILVSLDAGSSIAIENAAYSQDAKVIEYDRQVKGGRPRSTSPSTAGRSASCRARVSWTG